MGKALEYPLSLGGAMAGMGVIARMLFNKLIEAKDATINTLTDRIAHLEATNSTMLADIARLRLQNHELRNTLQRYQRKEDHPC